MWPGVAPSTEVVKGSFLYPDDIITSWCADYEMGGIALQDTSQGLLYQPWYGRWDQDTGVVSLYPNIAGDGIPIFTALDIFEFSFSFDQSMRWVAVTVDTSNVMSLRWFDSLIPGYTVTTFSDVFSAHLALDDKRPLQILRDISDVILTYVKLDGTLCYRIQRERYATEHVIANDVPEYFRITNFGMSNKLRLQWRLQFRSEVSCHAPI